MASHYEEKLTDDDGCDFEDDLKRIKYIKRLLSKYRDTGILKTRLLLNHIVILMNTLGPFATTRILLYKIEEEHHEVVSTFLHKLNALEGLLKNEMSIDVEVCKLINKEMR
jgi:hypothetical protein